MKTFSDIDERMDMLFEANDKEGIRGGQIELDLIEAQRVIYKADERARQRGFEGDYENVFQIPTPVFNPKHVLRVKVGWMCREGHTTKMKLTEAKDAFENMDREPCGTCRRNFALVGEHPVHKMARVRYVMQHDERGEDMEIDVYQDSTIKHVYTDRVSGTSTLEFANNLHQWTRKLDPAKKIVYIAEDGEYAFLWCGTRPKVKNPVLKDLFERADARIGDAIIEPYYDPEFQIKKGYTHRKGLENAIVEAGDLGAKVLNIGLNPQFISPGAYTWGNIATKNAALAEYIESIHKEWIEHLSET